MRPPPRRDSGPGLLAWLLLLLVLGVALTVPLLGAWVASALASHHGASTELAAGAGLLVFPVLPVLWELLSQPGRRRDGTRAARALKLPARMLLRTWGLSLALLGGLLVLRPQELFTALSSKGDWMLPSSGSTQVEGVRRFLSATTNGLEQLHARIVGQSPPVQAPSAPPPAPPSAAPTPTPPKPEFVEEGAPVQAPSTEPAKPEEEEEGDEEGTVAMISWKPEPKAEPKPEPKPSQLPPGVIEVSAPVARYTPTPSPPRPRQEEAPRTGVRIISPLPGAEVTGRFLIELDNPEGLQIQVNMLNLSTYVLKPCHQAHGDRIFSCTAVGRARYVVQVSAGPHNFLPKLAAEVEVNGR